MDSAITWFRSGNAVGHGPREAAQRRELKTLSPSVRRDTCGISNERKLLLPFFPPPPPQFLFISFSFSFSFSFFFFSFVRSSFLWIWISLPPSLPPVSIPQGIICIVIDGIVNGTDGIQCCVGKGPSGMINGARCAPRVIRRWWFIVSIVSWIFAF